jgi:Transposase
MACRFGMRDQQAVMIVIDRFHVARYYRTAVDDLRKTEVCRLQQAHRLRSAFSALLKKRSCHCSILAIVNP